MYQNNLMLKTGTISLSLLIGVAPNAQPPFKQWYSFGLMQSIVRNALATDVATAQQALANSFTKIKL